MVYCKPIIKLRKILYGILPTFDKTEKIMYGLLPNYDKTEKNPV